MTDRTANLCIRPSACASRSAKAFTVPSRCRHRSACHVAVAQGTYTVYNVYYADAGCTVTRTNQPSRSGRRPTTRWRSRLFTTTVWWSWPVSGG